MGFLLIVYALAMQVLLLAIALFGLLWAPFGALACAWTAKSKGMPATRYAVRGLVYSLLLFFPWVYFMMRMSGRRIPASCIVVGYIALYGGWFAILLIISISRSNAIIALLHSTLLVVSLVQFYFVPSKNERTPNDDKLGFIYLSPFFYISIGLYIQLFLAVRDGGL